MTSSLFNKLLHNAVQNTIPIEVSIDLTHHCNFRCQHCYIPDFSAPDLLTTERVCSCSTSSRRWERSFSR